jgi:CelD/BcsL family acetyltransferase involved in cellulose biosynthesis
VTLALERVALGDPRWRGFADAHPERSVFHAAEWSSLLAGTYGYDAFAVIATERGKTIAGAPFLSVGTLFRRRWSSLPFTDQCAPLGDPTAIEHFVRALPAQIVRARVASVELRSDLSNVTGELVAVGFHHELSLQGGTAAVVDRIAPAHLRNVRRAEGHGVEVSIANDDEAMEAFYALHVRTRRRLGIPVQPVRFFRQLSRLLIRPGLGFIATAHLGRQPLAAAVFLYSGSRLIYKYGASDEREWQHRPNDLLFHAVIAKACTWGLTAVDFGRTDDGDLGLRRFKSSWGATETELRYTNIGKRSRKATGVGLGLLGPVIRRSSPVVCRAIGEALYRYSA